MARMFVCNADIGKSTMTSAMRDFVKLKTCRRAYLLKFFGYEVDMDQFADRKCCDNCDQAAGPNELEEYVYIVFFPEISFILK